MITKLKQLIHLLTVATILVGSIDMSDNAFAQEPGQPLEWSIGTSKNTFYPGEPILLTLNIKSTGEKEEIIDFGADGIEAFSIEIRDSNNIIMATGGKIQKFGLSRLGTLLVGSGEMSHKSIVLNRWCSTLLIPGQYHVICNAEYRLRSESRKKEDSEVYKAGPVHKIQLGLDIRIIETNVPEFKEMIENLASIACETEPKTQNKKEWLTERDCAREMLALTESELAVPYQLKLLRTDPYTWFGPDAINSLVKSGTSEAATGLIQIIEDANIHKGEMKPVFIDGVYRLRDTGKSEIIAATSDFVAKHKRPVLAKPMD